MQPDTIFKCIKSYNGTNAEGKPICFEEGKEYIRTSVDMQKLGHGSKGRIYYIHDWEDPSKGNIELSSEEFDKLKDIHFGEIRPHQ